VKHGLVSSPEDWTYSSFHRWVQAGVCQCDWGRSELGPLSFGDLDTTAMEMESV
jgi:putative transposase